MTLFRKRCKCDYHGVRYIEDTQIVLLNMSFISRVKWKIFIFHEWRSHEWNIIIVHFTREMKDIFNKKNI